MRLETDLRRLAPGRPPVLLLGRVNLVRALGAAGIPAIVATPDADEPTLASRYCAGRCLLPAVENRRAAAEALVQAGERIAERCGAPPPLFYGDDDYLELVLESRELLAPHFRLLLNDSEVARALIDKHRFQEFSRSRGLPVPRQLAWAELEHWHGAVLVKPKAKTDWEHSKVLALLFGGAGKARIFERPQELLANGVARQLAGELMLQEYIPGDDRRIGSFHGYADERGKLLAWFVGRKVRTYPALTGASTFLELVHDDGLAAVGREVASRAALKGVFKMDFKQDARDGSWRLLEINARFNLWHNLGARNGVNLPAIAYEYLVRGTRPSRSRYVCGYRWLSFKKDYRAYRDLSARGELTFARWLWSIVRGPKVYDLFAWNDPMPFARALLRRAKRIPRLTLRMWRWLFTAS